jgi:mannose-6-phosphate isomerase-like protein (cupin superfamily)
MSSAIPSLEIFNWTGQGYQPLVFSHDWQAALLNWEPIFDLDNVGEVERHTQTDEVFVLLNGQAVLFTIGADGLQVVDMQPGVIYNVSCASWHNLISTRDARWLIVENRDTHLNDCEFRPLTSPEKADLLSHVPDWVRQPIN